MKSNTTVSKEIHRLLNNTTILPELFFKAFAGKNDNSMHMKLTPLYEYLNLNHPKKLFRFRQFNSRSINALKENQIYLTRADRFNDPYDCLLHFDKQKIQSHIEESITQDNIRRLIKQKNLSFPINESIRNENDLVSVFFQRKSEFLDVVIDNFPEITGMLQRNMYIACFSENVTNPVMWAHYADNHEGFAIEYQFESDVFCPRPHFPADDKFDGFGWRSLLPVYYSKYCADGTQLAEWYSLCKIRSELIPSYPKEDFSMLLPDMLLKTKLSLIKFDMWAYEREWRMILSHEYPNYFGEPNIHFVFQPSGIYVGSKANTEQRRQLIEIGVQKQIPVYEMYVNHSSKEYEMEYAPI